MANTEVKKREGPHKGHSGRGYTPKNIEVTKTEKRVTMIEKFTRLEK